MIHQKGNHFLGLIVSIPPSKLGRTRREDLDEGKTLKEAAIELGLVTSEQFDQWVDPGKMV